VAEQAGIPGLSADDMAQGYGYMFINAAFAYPRPSGNRFNPSRWGSWYSAFTVNTALHEVAFHLTWAGPSQPHITKASASV
jgi:hypothetical protein